MCYRGVLELGYVLQRCAGIRVCATEVCLLACSRPYVFFPFIKHFNESCASSSTSRITLEEGYLSQSLQ